MAIERTVSNLSLWLALVLCVHVLIACIIWQKLDDIEKKLDRKAESVLKGKGPDAR